MSREEGRENERGGSAREYPVGTEYDSCAWPFFVWLMAMKPRSKFLMQIMVHKIVPEVSTTDMNAKNNIMSFPAVLAPKRMMMRLMRYASRPR